MVSAGFGGGPLDEGLGVLERGLAPNAGADEELADLAPEPCGVGDDGAEIDVVGHPVEGAAERGSTRWRCRGPRRPRDRR